MSGLNVNGDGNTGAIKDTVLNPVKNEKSNEVAQVNCVWGEFNENGDKLVNIEDIQLNGNATNLQKRVISDFLGVHKGKEWTEKLINIVKNLFINSDAIEETMNNEIYSRINIKDEKGELYQTSYDYIDCYKVEGIQVKSDTISKNQDGSIVKTSYSDMRNGKPIVCTRIYDKEGFLVSSKNELSNATANFDRETNKISFTQGGEEICYAIKDSDGKMTYYLPNGDELGDKNAVWAYANKNSILNLTSVFSMPLE